MYYLYQKTLFLIQLVVFFLLLSSQQITAQTTAVPDTVFEKKLIVLGIDSDGLVNGQLLTSDAATVTSLTLSGDTLRSLKGIEDFVNLHYLEIRNTRLDSLIITNHASLGIVGVLDNDQLKYVDCSHNPVLTDANYLTNSSLNYANSANNPNLVSLNFYNNSLDSVEVSHLPALVTLNCSENNLSSLNISSSTGLQILTCDHNNVLSNLDLSNNTALTTLSVAHNGMTALSVTHLPALTHFNCSENALGYIDLSQNTNLIYLGVTLCNLSTLNVTNQPNLELLYCGLNDFSTLNLSNNPVLRELSCRNNELVNLDMSNQLQLDRLQCQNNQLARLVLPSDSIITLNCTNNPAYLRICVPDAVAAASQDASNGGNWLKDPWAVYTEDCPHRVLTGRVVIDDNNNCLIDTTEAGKKNQLIQFKDHNNQLFYSTTIDSNGNYEAYLDTGTYTVSIPFSSTYWQGCPDSQLVYVDTSYVVQNLDWVVQAVVNCPLLTVAITAPFLRKTGGGSSYTVAYSNIGTASATSAYVEVELDSALQLINTSIPLVSQVGTTYRFQIGNIGIGETGAFSMQVLVDTNALLAQTHCTKASIYPDTLCISNLWRGPSVQTTGRCSGENVVYTIKNTGNDMARPLNYYIVEDNIMMRQGSFKLNSLTSVQVVQAASPGHTYRIWAEQETGYPTLLGHPFATAFVEGCVLDSVGGFNTGFVLPYDNNDGSPSVAVDCQENITAYDPNDKAAQIRGYGALHYIYDYTVMDYKVRFQNTGNDTAFTVVIRDTLSPHLNPSTFVMGASSHVSTWNLSQQGILEVQFDNILLVDSLTNEPASHGFFTYQIHQQPNNPMGTTINNRAAIYFDYNPPIFTNTTFHTVGEDFIPIVITIKELYPEQLSIKVFPNPFTYQTTLEVEGRSYETLTLEVVDVTGRVVEQVRSQQNNQLTLERKRLSQGFYFYRLLGDSQLIGTGKLQVQ